jgi:hypothetical protein
MPRPKPRVASLKEVTITRRGDAAHIEFLDGVTPSMRLTIGPEVARMSDRAVLMSYNRVVRAMQWSVANYKHVAVEIPEGKPQLEYHALSDTWCARGGVLRCEVSDDENRNPVITIDDRELTWDEFGRTVVTWAGWGMRVIFVPENELTKPPVIEVREPND